MASDLPMGFGDKIWVECNHSVPGSEEKNKISSMTLLK